MGLPRRQFAKKFKLAAVRRLEAGISLTDMVLTGVDQLWRADITYVRLREEFVFLAVILNAFSRRFIGWALIATWKMS